MKIIKPLIITLGIIIVLLVIIALLTPPVAKNYIVKHSKELTGRQIRLQGLYLNIFTGYVRLTGFELLEEDEQDAFVTFDTLSIDMSLYRLLASEIRVNHINLVNPHLKIWQKGSAFNFDDLIALGGTDTTQVTGDTVYIPETLVDSVGQEAPSNSMAVALYNISIRDGQIQYRDIIRNSNWGMDNFNLQIPGVYFSGKNTDVGIALNFNDGGHLQTQIQYNMEAGNYVLDIALTNFSIAPVKPYLTDFLNINAINGFLNTHLNIEGNAEHITDLAIRGNISLQQLALTDQQDKQVFATDSLVMELETINPGKAIFHFNCIAINGLQTLFEMRKDGNTFTDLLKAGTADTTSPVLTAAPENLSEPEINPDFKINTFRINHSLFVFNDKTLHTPFTFNLENINLIADNFTLNDKNKAKITSTLNNGGKIALAYEGKIDDLSNTDLMLTIKNLDLKTFTPYSLQYFGYPLKKGILSFSSLNDIHNNQLDGRNSLNIAKCEVESKQKAPEPEYNIPLKTALYLIKDKNDQIKIDLPVKGNINSPEFSYKKIIFKTLTNLLVKVAVSPINFLAGSLGFSPDKLKDLPFEVTQNDFTPEQLTKINQLAEMLKAKPEMTLLMEQFVNLRQSKLALARFYIKRSFYLQQYPEKTLETIQPIDYPKITEIDTKDPNFLAFVNQRVTEDLKEASIDDQILSLANAGPLDQLTQHLMEKRNQALTTYLTRQGVPAKNFRITTASEDQLNQYNGHNLYTLRMVFEGDEPEGELSQITE